MESNTIHRIITSRRGEIDGDYSSTARVIDTLLDIRLAAAGSDSLLALVDGAIADAPGRYVVPNQWWNEKLDQLESLTLAEEQVLTTNCSD